MMAPKDGEWVFTCGCESVAHALFFHVDEPITATFEFGEDGSIDTGGFRIPEALMADVRAAGPAISSNWFAMCQTHVTKYRTAIARGTPPDPSAIMKGIIRMGGAKTS